jgi:sterol desaturase/sphingolipid hydroxylase (fatty acid hydroxylase superfamily)
MHINGHLDAVPFAVLLIAISFRAPYYQWPVFVAGLLQSYVIEEWVHYSVHFHRFRSRYFQYIRLHHWYHHSVRGSERAFGLTSGLWDAAVGTPMPERRYRPQPELGPGEALSLCPQVVELACGSTRSNQPPD